jgi:16S rRNA (adenine1518-N6/adenine1519-N6)-dimethyltransferase
MQKSLKAHLRDYGSRPKKALGQVFLIDHAIQQKILDLADLHPEDTVVEIGPGTGALTREMLGRVRRLIAVEIDRDLVSYLRTSLPHGGNLRLIHMDALDFPYQRAADRLQTRLKIVGNIPYQISAPLLFRFMDQWKAVSGLVLMVQKEVAERLTSPPGTREYGLLSVLMSIHYNIRIRQKVSRNCFSPVPKVDSAVIQCVPCSENRLNTAEERVFRRVVKAAFSKRRKTIFNALKLSPEIAMQKERLRAVLEQASIDPIRRPETLSPREFLHLARCFLDASDAK